MPPMCVPGSTRVVRAPASCAATAAATPAAVAPKTATSVTSRRVRVDDRGELAQARDGLLAQQLRRVVGLERVRPERASGKEAGGAALARVLDRERELVLRHALRENDPRHRQRLRDLTAARDDVALRRR